MPEVIAFILSTGRTGTKTLAEGLCGEEITSPHQPPFSRILTIASNYYIHGWIPKNVLTWMIKNLREPQILNAESRYYIQVYAHDFLPAKILSEKYPDLRVVHIVRDPRNFVYSYLNWMHSRFKSLVANKIVLGWHPSGFFTGECSRQEWREMDEFQRVCWQWMFKNTYLEDLFEHDSRYLQVRFEDVFLSGDADTLRKVVDHIGIPYHDRFNAMLHKPKNVSRKGYVSPWEAWDPFRCAQLDEICNPLMTELGYGQESLWQERVREGKESTLVRSGRGA